MTATEGSPIPLAFLIVDHPVVVEVPDQEAARALRSMLCGFDRVAQPLAPTDDDPPYRLVRGEGGERRWAIEVRGVRALEQVSLDEAVIGLECQLVADALAATPGRCHLHGAALLDPSGAASVLILGESGSGKTTLALALIGLGFEPFTDDVILIDPDTLAPRRFGRTFHVDAATRSLAAGLVRPPAVDEAGLPAGHVLPGRWAQHEAPVRAVFVATRHAASAASPAPAPTATRLSIPEAAATLLPFSATLAHDPRLALRCVSRLTASAACYALTSGDLAASADVVAAEVARLSRDHNPAR